MHGLFAGASRTVNHDDTSVSERSGEVRKASPSFLPQIMVSDEESRWIVVGIAMTKVVAPVLRDFIKKGMDTHYNNLDNYLTPFCTLKTLTYHRVKEDSILRNLKFQNINNNDSLGNKRSCYNFKVNSTVDLAKLYLPSHLAMFSAFDHSLDMNTILNLLAFSDYKPIAAFSILTQNCADDVRKNVRNKWGHFDPTEWTETFFSKCFDTLQTLVRCLGLSTGVEKATLDLLADWQTKGTARIILISVITSSFQ